MIDIYNLFVSYDKFVDLRETHKKKIEVMLHWSINMSHPDGDISFFNDAAFGIAPKIEQIYNLSRLSNITANQNLNHFKKIGINYLNHPALFIQENRSISYF